MTITKVITLLNDKDEVVETTEESTYAIEVTMDGDEMISERWLIKADDSDQNKMPPEEGRRPSE